MFFILLYPILRTSPPANAVEKCLTVQYMHGQRAVSHTRLILILIYKVPNVLYEQMPEDVLYRDFLDQV